jgi:hypothetical protein
VPKVAHDWDWHLDHYCALVGDPSDAPAGEAVLCTPQPQYRTDPAEFRAYEQMKRELDGLLSWRKKIVDFILTNDLFRFTLQNPGALNGSTSIDSVDMGDIIDLIDEYMDQSSESPLENRIAAAIMEGNLNDWEEATRLLGILRGGRLNLNQANEVLAAVGLESEVEVQNEREVVAHLIEPDGCGASTEYYLDRVNNVVKKREENPCTLTVTETNVAAGTLITLPSPYTAPDGRLFRTMVEGTVVRPRWNRVTKSGQYDYRYVTMPTANNYRFLEITDNSVTPSVNRKFIRYSGASGPYVKMSTDGGVNYYPIGVDVLQIWDGEDTNDTIDMFVTNAGEFVETRVNKTTQLKRTMTANSMTGWVSHQAYYFDPNPAGGGQYVQVPTPGQIVASIVDAVTGLTTEFVRTDDGRVLKRRFTAPGEVSETLVTSAGSMVLSTYNLNNKLIRQMKIDQHGDLYVNHINPSTGQITSTEPYHDSTFHIDVWNGSYTRSFVEDGNGEVRDRICITGAGCIRDEVLESWDERVVARLVKLNGTETELVADAAGEVYQRPAEHAEGAVRHLRQDTDNYYYYSVIRTDNGTARLFRVPSGNGIFLADHVTQAGTKKSYLKNNGVFGLFDTAFSPVDLENLVAAEMDPFEAAAALSAVDHLIEALLRRARGAGCLDYNDSQVHKPVCDWSPKLFAQSLNTTVTALRENDFKKCVQATGGRPFFANQGGQTSRTIGGYTLPLLTLAPIDGFPYPVFCDKTLEELYQYAKNAHQGSSVWDDYYTVSTWRFDQFIEHRDRACKELLEEKGAEIENLNRDGQDNSREEEDGNDRLALTYDYNFTYGISPLDRMFRGSIGETVADENGTCFYVDSSSREIKAHATGRFGVGLAVFGEEVELVDVYSRAELKRGSDGGNASTAHIDFSVFDMVTYGVDFDKDNHGEEKGKSYNREFFRVKSYFSVGPVPMSITAGATGRLGVDFNAVLDYEVGTLEFENWCQSNPDLEEIQIAVGLNAGLAVAPLAGLDAFARVAVDLGVAAFGLEGVLTVIEVRLPFELSFKASGELSPKWDGTKAELGLNLNLDLVTNLDAELRTLDGRVNVFVELLGGVKTFRKKLFGWEGFSDRWNLLHSEVSLLNTGGIDIKLN